MEIEQRDKCDRLRRLAQDVIKSCCDFGDGGFSCGFLPAGKGMVALAGRFIFDVPIVIGMDEISDTKFEGVAALLQQRFEEQLAKLHDDIFNQIEVTTLQSDRNQSQTERKIK